MVAIFVISRFLRSIGRSSESIRLALLRSSAHVVEINVIIRIVCFKSDA